MENKEALNLIEKAEEKGLITEEEAIEKLKEIHPKIIKVLKKYCDLHDDYYEIIALWIIGTYFHKQFPTFPYLFLNAMKGSGKTRILRLIIELCHNGRLINNLSEAVLFRTASERSFGIDEFEHVGNKEKGVLRELLNSAYKKGTIVERAVKVKGPTEEKYRIDAYELYCPIVMANIWGMDEVLSDRCISLTIDKSSKKNITQLLEIFSRDKDILAIKQAFSAVSAVPLCSTESYMDLWNEYIENNNNGTIVTNGTYVTNGTEEFIYKFNYFFRKVIQTGIDSRHLELFFPLFMVSEVLGNGTIDKILEIAVRMVNEKKDDDMMENRDVQFLDFIAQSEDSLPMIDNFVFEKDILENYKRWIEYDEKNREFDWLHSKWIGRALKRLNLIIEKKKRARGRMINVNFSLAKEKARMFQSTIKEENIESNNCIIVTKQ